MWPGESMMMFLRKILPPSQLERKPNKKLARDRQQAMIFFTLTRLHGVLFQRNFI
jgi:hypothetical protein